jgi:DNA-binding PadR family transcriptional regulator
VYPTLQLLEEGGYLSSEPVEGKKVYSITESGRELLAENQEALQAMEMPEEAPQIMELRNALRDLHEVVHQVARSGDETRMQRVLGSLKKIRREIYLILAEEE